MKVLIVVPMFPGGRYDGSAVYHRMLNDALRRKGVATEVLSTRSAAIQEIAPFAIRWPRSLPARELIAGTPVRRFRAVNLLPLGLLATGALLRRWSREDAADGALTPDSAHLAVTVDQARGRPARYSTYADLGRGPVVPGLLAHMRRVAPRFDAVIAGYAPFSLMRQTVAAAHGANLPVALLPFIHDTDRSHHFTGLYSAYAQADRVLTLSEHTAEFLSQHVPGCVPDTIGAGSTVEAVTADPSELTAFRDRHRLRGRRVLLFVGRKHPSKRYDLAVDAVRQLSEGVTLVMIGADSDHRPLSHPQVRYLGNVSARELSLAYQCCDAFVLPSEHESFGMAFLDAWTHRKPVIGNARCGSSVRLIEHGVDGYLAADAADLAASAARLLDDAGLAAAMGAAGHRKATGEYTWDRVAERTIVALEQAKSARDAVAR